MKIAIRNHKDVMMVDQEDILYCKAEGRYTCIYFRKDNSILSSKLLKDVESALSDRLFCRIHNSYLINMNYISRISEHRKLVLNNGIELPIAKRRHRSLNEHIANLNIEII